MKESLKISLTDEEEKLNRFNAKNDPRILSFIMQC